MKTWENCLNKHIASFVSTKENFYNSARGVGWLRKQQYVSKNDNYICNGEYVYEDIEEVKKFKEKNKCKFISSWQSNKRSWFRIFKLLRKYKFNYSYGRFRTQTQNRKNITRKVF